MGDDYEVKIERVDSDKDICKYTFFGREIDGMQVGRLLGYLRNDLNRVFPRELRFDIGDIETSDDLVLKCLRSVSILYRNTSRKMRDLEEENSGLKRKLRALVDEFPDD